MKKTIEEQLRDMRIKKEKTLEEQLKAIRISKDEIYNQLVDAYENNKINEEIFAENDSKAINKYKGKLEKELLSIDNITEGIIQRISDYIGEKQRFRDFDPIDSAKAGVFLTKLIEISPLTEITLKLEKGSGIDFFGYRLAEKKKIIVHGDLGGSVGNHMKAGELEINGNVNKSCGYNMIDGYIGITGYVGASGISMKGGKIVVHGDVKSYCGTIMKGGVIEIGGNAHRDVADSMYNGKIHISGNVNRDCGTFMEGGLVKIDGNVNGECGDFMKGGLIEINGNVNNYVAKFMEGGTIRINGGGKEPKLHPVKLWFFGQYRISKKGGSVYHKGEWIG